MDLFCLLEPVYMAGPAHLWANSCQMFPPCCVDSSSLLFNLKSLPQGLCAGDQAPDGASVRLGIPAAPHWLLPALLH